mmetsp:Transcript_1752/g.4000  ORF Transcript_1752/g.4000 Transcript_1752/m.4000 type:complete len:238 (-) Transcript_1752:152-865(-)
MLFEVRLYGCIVLALHLLHLLPQPCELSLDFLLALLALLDCHLQLRLHLPLLLLHRLLYALSLLVLERCDLLFQPANCHVLVAKGLELRLILLELLHDFLVVGFELQKPLGLVDEVGENGRGLRHVLERLVASQEVHLGCFRALCKSVDLCLVRLEQRAPMRHLFAVLQLLKRFRGLCEVLARYATRVLRIRDLQCDFLPPFPLAFKVHLLPMLCRHLSSHHSSIHRRGSRHRSRVT